jgi:hypothetical protein
MDQWRKSASKCTNKTVIQCIHFAVEQDQKGWVWALPKVHFDIMNTINVSTNFTSIQLCFGKLAHILPPLIPIKDDEENNLSA